MKIAVCTKRFEIEEGKVKIYLKVNQRWKFHKRQNNEYWLKRNNVEIILSESNFVYYFCEENK